MADGNSTQATTNPGTQLSVIPDSQANMFSSDDSDDLPSIRGSPQPATTKRKRTSEPSADASDDAQPPAKTRKPVAADFPMDTDIAPQPKKKTTTGGVRGGRARKAGKETETAGTDGTEGQPTATEGEQQAGEGSARNTFEWKGKAMTDDDVSEYVTNLFHLGLFDGRKFDLSNKAKDAQKQAFLGYVLIDILDDSGRDWITNEINPRPVDEHQAELLIGSFLDTKCEPMLNPLVACIDLETGEGVFVPLQEGQAFKWEQSPGQAILVKSVGDVWRIAGAHRTYGIRVYFKRIKDQLEEANSLLEQLRKIEHPTANNLVSIKQTEGAVNKFNQIIRLIQEEWRFWPVAVYRRGIIMQDTPAMKMLQGRLAGNERPHQYEGTHRENFQMAFHDPVGGVRFLKQDGRRIWYARSLREMFSYWVPFTGLANVDTFAIMANSERIDKPLRRLTELVTPSAEHIKSAKSSSFTSASYFGFVTPDLVSDFDLVYNRTIAESFKTGFPIQPDGYVTVQYRQAFLDYCASLETKFTNDINNQTDLPVGMPEDWYKLKIDFRKMLATRIKAVIAAVEAFNERKTPFSAVTPWFSRNLAEAFRVFAEQVGPAMSIGTTAELWDRKVHLAKDFRPIQGAPKVVRPPLRTSAELYDLKLSEILDQAWRLCRAYSFRPGTKPKGSINRKDSDYPDDSAVVLFQATRRIKRKLPEAADPFEDLSAFVAHVTLSPLGPSLSLRVVNLGLRQIDGLEAPPLSVPTISLKAMDLSSATGSKNSNEPTDAIRLKMANAYFYDRIIRAAVVEGRKDFKPGEVERHLRQTIPVSLDIKEAISYLPTDFSGFFDGILGQSYFPNIAHAITVQWKDHVSDFYSLYRWLRATRSSSLQLLVNTVEFQHVWRVWTAMAGSYETYCYHTFLDMPSGDPPVWTQPRLQSFALALSDTPLPASLGEDPLDDEKSLAIKRRRAAKKSPTFAVDANGDSISGEDEASDDVGVKRRKRTKKDTESTASASKSKQPATPAPPIASEGPPSASPAATSLSQPLAGAMDVSDARPPWITGQLAAYHSQMVHATDPDIKEFAAMMFTLWANTHFGGFSLDRLYANLNGSMASFVCVGCAPEVLPYALTLRWPLLYAVLTSATIRTISYFPSAPDTLKEEMKAASREWAGLNRSELPSWDIAHDFANDFAQTRPKKAVCIPFNKDDLCSLRVLWHQVIHLPTLTKPWDPAKLGMEMLDRVRKLAPSSAKAASGNPALAPVTSAGPPAPQNKPSFPPLQFDDIIKMPAEAEDKDVAMEDHQPTSITVDSESATQESSVQPSSSAPVNLGPPILTQKRPAEENGTTESEEEIDFTPPVERKTRVATTVPAVKAPLPRRVQPLRAL
ncbi:hypothetical protein FRB90_007048 [Tulasnella sp. 427]|nr:hypothetical protein FRB90_007048 [Tulasnella sp. 427]